MATKKPAAKVVAKKPAAKATPAKKAVTKPAAKAVPAKKVAPKPAPKKVAIVAKKVAAPAKKAAVPAKKVAAPVKKAPVKATPAPKKATPPPAKNVKPEAKAPVKVAKVPKAPKAPKKPLVPVKRVVKVAPRQKEKAPSTPRPVIKENIAAVRIVKATNRIAPSDRPKVVAAPPVKRMPPPLNAKDIKIIPAKAVSIPKINTKSSVRYEPDFMQSVLDESRSVQGEPLIRYNDQELAEFRELIMRKLNAAKKELNYLQGLITRKDENGGEEGDNRYMTVEDGSLSMEREQLSQMASRQITFMDHLDKALMRIESKTYGICRVTGKLIEKPRLMAVPHATLSMEAKSSQNR